MVFGDKNSVMCLLHKTNSFLFENLSDLFLRTKKNKKNWFVKDQICFMIIKKRVFNNRKIKSVFYMF